MLKNFILIWRCRVFWKSKSNIFFQCGSLFQRCLFPICFLFIHTCVFPRRLSPNVFPQTYASKTVSHFLKPISRVVAKLWQQMASLRNGLYTLDFTHVDQPWTDGMLIGDGCIIILIDEHAGLRIKVTQCW